MSRYWRIYKTFFTSSLARELEFRVNFFAKVLQNAVWIFFFLMILLVVYRNTDSVAGWGRGDAFILAATVFMMNAMAQALFFGVAEIPEHVRKGTLDFIITKPVDTQFWVSVRKFNFDQIGTFVAGLILVVVGVLTAKLQPGPAAVIAYAVLVASSLIIFYAFNLILMTTGIWLVRVDNLWVLGESLSQISRYPIDIYGARLQRLFLFVLPLGFIATVPARQLKNGFDPGMAGLGLLWAVVFFAFARWFWRFALRHYTSASS